jgi:hypothetical protein
MFEPLIETIDTQMATANVIDYFNTNDVFVVENDLIDVVVDDFNIMICINN